MKNTKKTSNQPAMLSKLIQKNRSYRRFDQTIKISSEQILSFINLARLSPSARNQQSLKYFVSNNEKTNHTIFTNLAWAGFLKDWNGPEEGQKPTAYIIITNDTNIAKNHFCDEGIACQSILLGAVEQGLGGCIFGAINRSQLQKQLDIDTQLEILYVIALGKPIEVVVIETIEHDNYKYWRDDNNIHHVPKRNIGDITTILD